MNKNRLVFIVYVLVVSVLLSPILIYSPFFVFNIAVIPNITHILRYGASLSTFATIKLFGKHIFEN